MNRLERVGVLTFHDTVNYGGLFQCLAIQQILKVLGYESFVIDYQTSRISKQDRTKVRHLVGKILAFMNGPLGANQRKKKTQEFIKSEFSLSQNKYTTLQELQSNPPIADSYIVGSDQVWNPQITDYDDAFFLNFGQPETKRISYAASIGIDALSDREFRWIQDGLTHLDEVSVREKTASDLISEKTEVNCVNVLDPTLLLSADEWREKAGQNKGAEFLLLYVLPGNQEVEKSLKGIARAIAERQNLELKILGDREIKRLMMNKQLNFGVGPQEFLNLLCNAKCVVTNSFHGTAFSANLSIPFVSVVPQKSDNVKSRGSRLVDFAQALELQHRVLEPSAVNQFDGEEIFSVMRTEDLALAQKLLKSQRHLSLEWLKKALAS